MSHCNLTKPKTLKLSQYMYLCRLFLPVGGGSREGNEVEGRLHQETWAAAELIFASHGVS